ncbi:hypothetical protein KUTeg_023898 [Tegillarca granosa]|uniref:Histone-lysine N-methyltransferase NSD-like PHD zinc finger 1 domain-containing protein n=1 Tax=Tegillarca granosa TaxID=220873 RepID=A0ABQ9E4Y3_TEGGR|nr:hypothetical protein KUTeg_023898 [Tegillarca granosa]
MAKQQPKLRKKLRLLKQSSEFIPAFSFIPPLCPQYKNEKFPKVLTELTDEKCISTNYKELVDHCEKIKLPRRMRLLQLKMLHAGSQTLKLLFRFRFGRITASKVRNVCKTNPCSPSLSLIKGICYPEQTHLAVTKLDFSYFVVLTKKDVHIELVSADPEFFQSIIPNIFDFFTANNLPELVGKFYSRLPTCNVLKHQKICEEEGKMIACDNDKCVYGWFYMSCLKLKRPPKGKWYCPDCRKLPKFKRGKAF